MGIRVGREGGGGKGEGGDNIAVVIQLSSHWQLVGSWTTQRGKETFFFFSFLFSLGGSFFFLLFSSLLFDLLKLTGELSRQVQYIHICRPRHVGISCPIRNGNPAKEKSTSTYKKTRGIYLLLHIQKRKEKKKGRKKKRNTKNRIFIQAKDLHYKGRMDIWGFFSAIISRQSPFALPPYPHSPYQLSRKQSVHLRLLF